MNRFTRNSNSLKGYLFISLAVISWSFSEILQKLLQDSVPAMSKSFFRFFIGIMPLLLIMLIQKDFRMIPLLKRNLLNFIVAGVLGYGIGNFVYFAGVERTQANLGSAMYGTYPIFISIYSYFLLNEKSNLTRKIIGYVIGFAAVFLILTDFKPRAIMEAEFLVGNLLVLLGAAIWSIFSVFGKKITNAERPSTPNIDVKFNFIAMIMAGLTNLGFILFMPEERENLFRYSAEAWIYLILLGVFVTGIGTWLFFVGLKNIEVSKGISLALFKPFISMLLAYIILGEIPSLALVICLPFVFFAVFLINKK